MKRSESLIRPGEETVGMKWCVSKVFKYALDLFCITIIEAYQ